jgi:hypothetical protein
MPKEAEMYRLDVLVGAGHGTERTMLHGLTRSLAKDRGYREINLGVDENAWARMHRLRGVLILFHNILA